VLPEQQPFAHELAVHWQLPFKHAWPATHFAFPPQVHAPPVQPSATDGSHVPQPTPFVPHAVALGMVHVFPEQQPPGQLAGVQPLQTPPCEQVPPRHIWQAEPPVPQADGAVPTRHAFPEQQPLGHDVPSQVQLHTPFTLTHSCPLPQAGAPPHVQAPALLQAFPVLPQPVQDPPIVPHAAVVCCSHTFPLQQPFGQDAALQTHCPPEHA
jgi:hypothetical protein